MKHLLGPLLLVIAVFQVSVHSKKVSFPIQVLKPDLNAIAQYMKIGEFERAYIHWPEKVTFLVTKISTEDCLEIQGQFVYKKNLVAKEAFDGLIYNYRTNKFYFRPLGQLKNKDSVKEVPKKPVYYKQPEITVTKPYISIRYFGLEELQANIDHFYKENQLHFDTVLPDHPATFLVSPPNSDGHFLEYTFKGTDPNPPAAAGALQVLIGQENSKKVTLLDTTLAFRLVFDQTRRALTIPQLLDIHSPPLKNVYAVRMTTTGFLAEVGDSHIKMVNKHDLDSVSLPKRHSIRWESFLKKVQQVEPRFEYPKVEYSQQILPKSVQFQVMGNILLKRLNLRTDGEKSDDCPFVIEYQNEGLNFMFKGARVQRICTNDTSLWV